MTQQPWFDPSELFGLRVISHSGTNLGRVVAAIHHRHGCDVLVERRRWLRRSVDRFDITDLVRINQRTCRYSPGRPRLVGDSDDWSVA